MIVIVHGPNAGGKTLNAERLKNLFRCHRVVDEWDGIAPLRDRDLALTNQAPPFRVDFAHSAYPIDRALQELHRADAREAAVF